MTKGTHVEACAQRGAADSLRQRRENVLQAAFMTNDINTAEYGHKKRLKTQNESLKLGFIVQ